MPHNEARELLVVGYEATRDMPCIREAQPGGAFPRLPEKRANADRY